MLREEYAALNLKGAHVVEHDYRDEQGVTAVWLGVAAERERGERMERALEEAGADMLQLHDWIAEETDKPSRIQWAAGALNRLRASLSQGAGQ